MQNNPINDNFMDEKGKSQRIVKKGRIMEKGIKNRKKSSHFFYSSEKNREKSSHLLI